ncbi:hypothetical protein BDA96_09G204700 [Sorghum bicolor]|jgi:hypothetical protein|uniref:Uncharacterized protein n=2 Tax=Sorghum bicolor TaxID=4558 RepID=A0A921QBN6_SORBI|nr:uncharacterized protein LOC8067498 [Sorghum bicolor]EES18490.1 hypothetical protein SORBI_3009G194400 [Sorghum bicolor]KAG0518761.1 hypothetical protein BDA96_09G204700 [Sorghum bicolor]|eukprot:XP_002440060.1 uncharacterized protein LOC8067498 [Sorghum bicolor]
MRSKKAKGSSSSSKLGRWLGAPVRALSRACDSYVRQMTACAGRMPTPAGAYGGPGGFAPITMEAATFSSRSPRRGGDEEEDLNELFRALSLRQAAASVAATTTVPVRSRSVAVGRIDEDAPCEFFGADDDVVVRVGGGPAVRRARSIAVGSARLTARAGYYGAVYKPGAGVVRG